jgi:hypothetical protein
LTRTTPVERPFSDSVVDSLRMVMNECCEW